MAETGVITIDEEIDEERDDEEEEELDEEDELGTPDGPGGGGRSDLVKLAIIGVMVLTQLTNENVHACLGRFADFVYWIDKITEIKG